MENQNTTISDSIIMQNLQENRRKKRKIRIIISVISCAVALFMLINYRMIFAGIANTFRFVTGSAVRYDKLCDSIYEDILDRKKEIDLGTGLDLMILQRLAHEFSGNYPELFYISIGYSDYGGRYKLYITYNYTEEQIVSMTEELNRKADEIVVQTDGMKNVEKVKFFHDYLIENCSYTNGYHDAYNMLVHKRGVCSAYSLAFKLLLDRCGIENETVWSTLYNHEWNEVRLGGLWYQVDVTWDDADSGAPRYRYFLITDNSVTGHGHGQWQNCGGYVHACYSPIYMIRFSSLPKDVTEREAAPR